MNVHKWQQLDEGTYRCEFCGVKYARQVMSFCKASPRTPDPKPNLAQPPITEPPSTQPPVTLFRNHAQQAELLAICRSNACGQYLEGDLCGWQKSKGRAGALMSPRGIPSKAANCKHWPNG